MFGSQRQLTNISWRRLVYNGGQAIDLYIYKTAQCQSKTAHLNSADDPIVIFTVVHSAGAIDGAAVA